MRTRGLEEVSTPQREGGRPHGRESLSDRDFLTFKNKIMANRIWTDGEGLTWSTITELLGEEEDAPLRLKKCVLDLTDNLFLECKKREELKEQLKEIENDISFLQENIGSCISFAQRQLNCQSKLFYLHDRENKTVSVEKKDGHLLVHEEKLTPVLTG